MPNGKKKKGHKMATHKRKKRLVWKECIRQLDRAEGAPSSIKSKKLRVNDK